MQCKKCGTNVLDGMSFCPNCGSQMDIVNNNMQDGYNNYQQPMYNQPPVQQYQQPMYNQQPQVSSNYAYNNGGDNFNNNGNKASTGLIIGMIIAVIAAFGVVYYMFNDDKDKDPNSNSNSNITSNSNSNIESNSNSNITSNIISNSNSNITSNIVSNTTSNLTSNVVSNKPSNTTSNVVSNTTSNKPSNTTNVNYQSVNHNGYIFQIPKSYAVYSNTSSQLVLTDSTNTPSVALTVVTGDYSKMKNNLSALKKAAKSASTEQGVTVNKDPYIKTYGGVEFIIVEASINNYPSVIAYSKFSSTKVILYVVPKASDLYNFAYTAKTAKAA